MPARITLTAEGLSLVKRNLEKIGRRNDAVRAMKKNLEKACRRYRAEGHSGGRYQLSTPSPTYPPISMTSRVRMPPAEARERYEDTMHVYDGYGSPMEYDAWGRPSEDAGCDWYGTPLEWDYDRECWCHLSEDTPPAEAREEYEAYSEDWYTTYQDYYESPEDSPAEAREEYEDPAEYYESSEEASDNGQYNEPAEAEEYDDVWDLLDGYEERADEVGEGVEDAEDIPWSAEAAFERPDPQAEERVATRDPRFDPPASHYAPPAEAREQYDAPPGWAGEVAQARGDLLVAQQQEAFNAIPVPMDLSAGRSRVRVSVTDVTNKMQKRVTFDEPLEAGPSRLEEPRHETSPERQAREWMRLLRETLGHTRRS
ncbi:hypothetical protein EDB84DRAFT_1563048 [Lactarius hengduanensis]|nr:hypothetical protein EDB84DRAFT_1563048 [Lactarius hengduanensis]